MYSLRINTDNTVFIKCKISDYKPGYNPLETGVQEYYQLPDDNIFYSGYYSSGIRSVFHFLDNVRGDFDPVNSLSVTIDLWDNQACV